MANASFSNAFQFHLEPVMHTRLVSTRCLYSVQLNLLRAYLRDSFRREFANLGEVPSPLPNVHIVALAATASKSRRKVILCHSLGMMNVLLVSQSSNNSNI